MADGNRVSISTGAADADGNGFFNSISLVTAAMELPTLATTRCRSPSETPGRFFRIRVWLASARSILLRMAVGLARRMVYGSIDIIQSRCGCFVPQLQQSQSMTSHEPARFLRRYRNARSRMVGSPVARSRRGAERGRHKARHGRGRSLLR